jgi:hypothetical protein
VVFRLTPIKIGIFNKQTNGLKNMQGVPSVGQGAKCEEMGDSAIV